ncbi:MAG: outer membrane beta-barrel protein [Salinivirgaceae bacterium]|nr:outer membrane beta-barrel protein [Salinivirgaceae bacterium]
MRIKHLIALMSAMVISTATFAQAYVHGTVIDKKDNQGLPSAQVTLTPANGGDIMGSVTDLDGNFRIKTPAGKWNLKIGYVGYSSYEKTIEVTNQDIKIGTVGLKIEEKELDEVKVTGVMQRQEQRDDTTIFNAEAFKVNPDATTEDLLKKMPGMQIQGNEIKSGGETVKKVLVDGKEFFGDDPMAALRNISADMVSKIEVYDKQSDQAEFTGFSDGNEERTINILTKMGISKGRFGRAYAGVGTDGTDPRYEAGGNYNMFYGDHRVSLIGLLNNINQQNFSMEDMSSVSGGGMGMMGMMGGRGGWNGNGGKNRTGSFGVNYTLDKEDTIRIETSYRYGNTKNVSNSSSDKEYFKINEEDEFRTEADTSDSESTNYNHNLNLTIDWDVNKNNNIILRSYFSWQGSDSYSKDLSNTFYDDNLYRFTSNESTSDSKSYRGRAMLTARHRFSLPRRTLSLSLTTNINNRDNNSETDKVNQYAEGIAEAATNSKSSEKTDNDTKSISLSSSLMYTEPFGDHVALQINYSPSYDINSGNRRVNSAESNDFGLEFAPEDYKFSSNLSNEKETRYLRQRAGLGLNVFNGKVFNATFGVDYQNAQLESEQVYPFENTTKTNFSSIMPSARIQIQKGMGNNIRLNYRTNTNAPSVNQLQEVIDMSNILSYSTGDPNLKQSYSHNINLFIASNNMATSRGIFAMFNLSTTQNYIANSTNTYRENQYLDSKDENGNNIQILLPAGTSIVKPVNTNGFYSLRANLNYTMPVSLIKSTTNFGIGANMTNTPTLVNGAKGDNKNYSLTGNLTLSSNISQNVDFTLSYWGGYNIVENSLNKMGNQNYYNHTLSGNLNVLLGTRFVIATDAAHTYTNGLGANRDNNYVQWNAAFGCKFFKDRRGELRLKVNDILDKTQSVSRSIQNDNVTTTTTDVLRRYVMLTFTYKFQSYGEQKQSNRFPGGMMPPPGGMRMGGPRM